MSLETPTQTQPAMSPSDPVAPPPETPSAETLPPASSSTSSKPSKSKMPTWVKVFIIVVVSLMVLGVVGFVGIFFFVNKATKQAEAVSNQLVATIQNNDPNAAYIITSSDFQEATSESDLDTYLDELSPLMQGSTKIVERRIVKDSGQPETTVLVYTVDTSDGVVYLRVVLEKNDGKWQVQNFRVSETKLSADELN